MKEAKDIIKWGRIKPYFDKIYDFNTVDIETVNNELFLFGCTRSDHYYAYLDNFYTNFNNFIIDCIQNGKDVLTWSRYDNTHLIKLLLRQVTDKGTIKKILLRIGKVSPVFTYQFKSFTFILENVIKDSMLFQLVDHYGNKRRLVIYNLKNLYTSDLETTAKNYHIDYYSKLGEEYHIIDPVRFNMDSDYKKGVLLSNELDNRVLKDIASKFLSSFKQITGVYPKSIFTAGSIARSYLLVKSDEIDIKLLNFRSVFRGINRYDDLLDMSMRSYHGGKIESYILGYIKEAKIIDITSAYPYALAMLPKLTNKVRVIGGQIELDTLNKYFYAFIECDIYIDDPNFIHPIIVKSPINKTNLSPYGYLSNVVITKWEYDYLVKNHIKVDIKKTILIEHENEYPYKNLVQSLFNNRMENKKSNPSVADLFKTIINSLYGITFELTDVYREDVDGINWLGYRAGDFFNPVIASYITGIIRTYLSDVSYNIISNGGQVYLNMTDSIIYSGDVTLNVFSEKKILGKFEMPEVIHDVIILGAGRYEYKDEFEKYTIKNRGFNVSVKNKSFYNQFDVNNKFTVKNKTFVSTFRATTNKYGFNDMGHLLDDGYEINPFNLGGKRFIKNNDLQVNLNHHHVRTHPIYLDKELYNNKKD